MLKKNKLLVIMIVFLLAVTINSICFASNESENLITKDFELDTCVTINGKTEYGSYVNKEDEDTLLSVKAEDYNLPSNLEAYRDDIRLRISYSQDDYKVYDCKVINYHNGEIIEDLSEENIVKLFNVGYGKDVTEKNWTNKIKLSELKENEIYKYTANSKVQFPEIENDLGKNCIIYLKENEDKNYKEEISMYKKISSSAISASFNEYNSGDTFNIMYKTINNDELLNKVPKDKIIYLSKYNDGDKLKYTFEKYIYNDTQKDITVHTKDTSFEIETNNSVVIEKGKIYGFDWMIDSAIINYTEDTTNKDDDNKTEENSKKDDIETPKDDTITNGKLPQTGANMTIVFEIIAVIIIAIVCYKKYYNYKDIK